MLRNPIPWPNGARCACAITFDVDSDSLIHISRPEDSHRRLYPISMGRYDQTAAVPRILDTYRRLGLKQSFFMPGWVMEQAPSTVEAILKDGHEIGHHGYLHEDPTEQTDAEQAQWFNRAVEVHRRMTGRKPRGYRAPVYNVTPGVINLMLDHGFTYDSSMMADDLPYAIRTPKGQLMEIPVHWGTDDWPPFAHYAEIGYMMQVQSPALGLAGAFEEFEAQYEAGGLWVAIWHPFLTGRLARWRVVERWLERVLSDRSVWFAPLEEIAAHVAGLARRGVYTPHVEAVPPYGGPILPALRSETSQ
jgi:peptidoglycan-N-acetylglucosamine deacetylase